MRQTILAIIDVALISGLLWSLWFVVHSSRRRTRHIADQLAAPITRTTDPMVIGVNRKQSIASIAPIIVMTVVGLEAVVIGKTATGFLLLVIFVPVLFLGGREVLRRRPVLALDGSGITLMSWKRMTLRPTERFVSWDSIRDVRVKERNSFGVTRHELVCELVPPEEVEVRLEGLSMPWNDVVRAIQNRLGRRVETAKP